MLDAFKIKCGNVSCFTHLLDIHPNAFARFLWQIRNHILLSNHGLVKLQLFVKAFSFYNFFFFFFTASFFILFYFLNEMLSPFLYHVINLRVHIETLCKQCKIHYILNTFRLNNQQVFMLILTFLYVFQLSFPLRSVY